MFYTYIAQFFLL